MTILITGATGKLARSLIKQLVQTANQPIILATRSGNFDEPLKTIKFDWFNENTYQNPFDADSNIDKVFLIQPVAFDVLAVIKPFVELAIAKGVKRFVYVSSSALEKGEIVNGRVHEYLADCGVDYCVLRPTTFIENYGTLLRNGIRDRDEIFSAAADGKVALVSIQDVAKVAFDALVSEQSPEHEVIIVGPQLYNIDEAAQVFSDILGRKITYRRITQDEYHNILVKFGMDEKYAGMLRYIVGKIADGSEEKITMKPGVYVGTYGLPDYVKANKQLWVKA